MKKLKLRPEVQCYPLWVSRDGVDENIAPTQLRLSSDLVTELDIWSNQWDAIYDLAGDPRTPAFPTRLAERQFWIQADVLANRLQSELGPEWIIEAQIPSC